MKQTKEQCCKQGKEHDSIYEQGFIDGQKAGKQEAQAEYIKKCPMIIKEQEANIVYLEDQLKEAQAETQKKVEELKEFIDSHIAFMQSNYGNACDEQQKLMKEIDKIFGEKK